YVHGVYRIVLATDASAPPGCNHLSLHDALPICGKGTTTTSRRASPRRCSAPSSSSTATSRAASRRGSTPQRGAVGVGLRPAPTRSEEHTSELQSRENLVCRLLLEKKKICNGYIH